MFSNVVKFLTNTLSGNGNPLIERTRALKLIELNHRYREEKAITFPKEAKTFLCGVLRNGLRVTFHKDQSESLSGKLIGTMDMADKMVSVCYYTNGEIDLDNNQPLLIALGRKESTLVDDPDLRKCYGVKEIIDFR